MCTSASPTVPHGLRQLLRFACTCSVLVGWHDFSSLVAAAGPRGGGRHNNSGAHLLQHCCASCCMDSWSAVRGASEVGAGSPERRGYRHLAPILACTNACLHSSPRQMQPSLPLPYTQFFVRRHGRHVSLTAGWAAAQTSRAPPVSGCAGRECRSAQCATWGYPRAAASPAVQRCGSQWWAALA